METGPRFLGPHLEAKVKDATLVRYRRALRLFLEPTIDFKLSPDTLQQFDDWLVEWKDTRSVSKAEFEGCIAAIELCLPNFKGSLKWSRAVASAWSVVHEAWHTVPMCSAPVALVAAHLSAEGHPRLGGGIVVQ